MSCKCTCSKCSSSSPHWHARPCSNSRLMTNIIRGRAFGGGSGGSSSGGASFGLTSTTPTSSWQLHVNMSNTPVTVPRKPFSDLDDVIESLKDPTICNIGMCYSRQGADEIVASEAVERIKRRSEKDSLFDSIVMVTVNKNPNLTEIQHQIADKLGIPLDGGDAGQKKMKKIWDNWGGNRKENFIIRINAKRISEAIIHNNQQQQQMKILFIFSNLHERLDLEKLGIASAGGGNSGSGHKFIFTSESEELLANHMNPGLLYMF